MSERIDLSERLFNLTCALLVSKVGLSKSEIFATVQGYKESFDPASDNASLSRMFERDKVLLTESGIKWRSFIPPQAMDDNQEYRYLIANEDFLWPKGVSLTSKQVALMNLAAKVWAKASLSQDASRALVRIRAMGESAQGHDLIGIAPRIRTHESAFLPLSSAIQSHSRVAFDYQKPESLTAERRVVEPWSLRNISGQWLLIAFDVDKSAVRNFLLRRIRSEVAISDEVFDFPGEPQLQLAINDLSEYTEKQLAIFWVPVRGAAWFHFNLTGEQDTVSMSFMDIHLLAEELMEFADEIEISEPGELKELVEQKLRKLANSHA